MWLKSIHKGIFTGNVCVFCLNFKNILEKNFMNFLLIFFVDFFGLIFLIGFVFNVLSMDVSYYSFFEF